MDADFLSALSSFDRRAEAEAEAGRGTRARARDALRPSVVGHRSITITSRVVVREPFFTTVLVLYRAPPLSASFLPSLPSSRGGGGRRPRSPLALALALALAVAVPVASRHDFTSRFKAGNHHDASSQ